MMKIVQAQVILLLAGITRESLWLLRDTVLHLSSSCGLCLKVSSQHLQLRPRPSHEIDHDTLGKHNTVVISYLGYQ